MLKHGFGMLWSKKPAGFGPKLVRQEDWAADLAAGGITSSPFQTLDFCGTTSGGY